MSDFWEGVEIISSYTDDDGMDDGMLVPLSVGATYQGKPVNIITRACLSHIVEEYLFDNEGEYSQAELVEGANDEFNSFVRGMCFTCPDHKESDEYMGFCAGNEFWVGENQSGGYTFMLPSDY